MAKTDFKSVDDYIDAQPAAAQAVLRRVRSCIRKVVPGAEEVISYQIPAYKRDGATVIYFAGWKQHYSIYPATTRVLEELRDQLASYKISKGTIRFPLSEPVPVKLIDRIARVRAKENSKRAKARTAARRKSSSA
jgi:uncharacterized protein YdhG (YjbR/CyaY superfamily)